VRVWQEVQEVLRRVSYGLRLMMMNVIYSQFALKSLLLVALFSSGVVIALSASVQAQQVSNTAADAREQGISLYRQGNDREAIEALRRAVKQRKEDMSAWHYLGLAYGRQGKTSDARKAHEKAAKLGEELLDRLLDYAASENFGADVRLYSLLLGEAADSSEKYLRLSSKPSKSKVEEWSERTELLRDYARLSGDGSENSAFKVYKTSEVTTKARILSRPEPQYTDEARQNQVAGTVVLRAIFAFDGKIRAIRVVSGLPNGLTSVAIKAARRIKFTPAMIDGKPVSQHIQIEYNFNLY
jgi:TonB family protein